VSRRDDSGGHVGGGHVGGRHAGGGHGGGGDVGSDEGGMDQQQGPTSSSRHGQGEFLTDFGRLLFLTTLLILISVIFGYLCTEVLSLDEELQARRKEHRARNSPLGRSGRRSKRHGGEGDEGGGGGGVGDGGHARIIERSGSGTSDTDSDDDDLSHREYAEESAGITTWRREVGMMDVPSAADSYWPNRDYETDHVTIAKPPSRGWSPAFTDFVNREHKIIRFNVGGTMFSTSRDTVANDEYCMLNVMLKHETTMARSRDESGAFFIDRDPTYFSYALNFLRNGIVDLPPERHALNALLREAEFYQINGLYSAVQMHRRRRARVKRAGLLTMINTRGSSELMLPNTDFSGEDLSHLSLVKGMFMNCDLCEADLRYSDFERTRFSGALFRGANLSNATFTEAKLDGADLTGANLQKTQLYKCDLKNANMRGCDLMRANLQQANLQGVSLQGANLQGVILHGADLRKFDLEGANLQGANLEGANLEGAILHRANLKGANLWEANLQDADLHQANLRDANVSFSWSRL
jgi:uncharacterized protein YjbI with pentapeptide repeats